MALIQCKNCGSKVSDQSPTCIHCGAKLSKRRGITKIYTHRILNVLSIFILIIICLLSSFIFINLNQNDGLFSMNYCNNLFASDYFIVSVILSLFLIAEILIVVKCRINRIFKFLSTLSILVGISAIVFFIFDSVVAIKYDCDLSLKTLIEQGNYPVEVAKKLNTKIDEVIYPYSEYSIPIRDIYSNDKNEQTFHFRDDSANEAMDFSLELKITDNKIEDMYWNFNDDVQIYLYQNYQMSEKANYYAKVIQYTNGDENCLTCNYLKSQIISTIKENYNISIDYTNFNSLYYDQEKDLFYYGMNIDDQQIHIYLLNKDNHELNYQIKLNEPI